MTRGNSVSINEDWDILALETSIRLTGCADTAAPAKRSRSPSGGTMTRGTNRAFPAGSFAPVLLLAEMPAVIAPEHDYGHVRVGARFQRGEQAPGHLESHDATMLGGVPDDDFSAGEMMRPNAEVGFKQTQKTLNVVGSESRCQPQLLQGGILDAQHH